MTTITIAGNDSYKGAVAAVYRLNSELKGSIIIQTRVRTVSNFNKENEQARILPRLYLTSFAYGVDKVFGTNSVHASWIPPTAKTTSA